MANENRLDLIDRNAVIAELDKFANPMPNESGYDFLCGMATAITEIEDTPTVDAAPVVHGRWEQVQRWATKAKYRCSVCGREIMSATKVNIEKYPYCHCGAKMDGDGNGT